jgi:hypothetical protein
VIGVYRLGLDVPVPMGRQEPGARSSRSGGPRARSEPCKDAKCFSLTIVRRQSSWSKSSLCAVAKQPTTATSSSPPTPASGTRRSVAAARNWTRTRTRAASHRNDRWRRGRCQRASGSRGRGPANDVGPRGHHISDGWLGKHQGLNSPNRHLLFMLVPRWREMFLPRLQRRSPRMLHGAPGSPLLNRLHVGAGRTPVSCHVWEVRCVQTKP